MDPDDYDLSEEFEALRNANLSGKKCVCGFFLATYGEGEPTDNCADFYSWIMDGNGIGDDLGNQHDHLVDEQVCSSLNYFVFGLGNKTYDHFNAIGRRINARMKQLGGNEIAKYGEGDDDGMLEENYLTWKIGFLKSIADYYGLKSDETSRKSRSHIPIFKLKSCKNAVDCYKGEYTSRGKRNWSLASKVLGNINSPDKYGDLIKRIIIGSIFMEERPRKPYDSKHPYYARIVKSESLFKNSIDESALKSLDSMVNLGLEMSGKRVDIERKCYHVELDLTSSDLSYKTGDHVGNKIRNYNLRNMARK